jgi:hypothetical protein
MKPVADDIWVPVIAEQLLRHLPRSKEHPDRLDPGSVPVFHYAARLLERLGYAEIGETGIILLEVSGVGPAKARWDDAYHIFFQCLEERQLIDYSPVSREAVVAMAESYGVLEEELDPHPTVSGGVTIHRSPHTRDAIVDQKLLEALDSIGLIAAGSWTGAAIPILWRKWSNKNPDERPADTTLFQESLSKHIESIPIQITEELEATVSIPEDLLDRKRAMLGGRDDEKEVWRLAGLARMLDLEFLLSQNWRFMDGWLSSDQREDCVFIGFDALASEFGYALVDRKFPDSDVARALKIVADARPNLH